MFPMTVYMNLLGNKTISSYDFLHAAEKVQNVICLIPLSTEIVSIGDFNSNKNCNRTSRSQYFHNYHVWELINVGMDK